jgi:hypothetical protein
MGLWKNSENAIWDDMDGAAIGLPSWPEGLIPITQQEADDIRNGVSYTYTAKTITLPFLSGWSKTLPERVFTKTTLEQARIDKLAAVRADRDALLQYSDLVAKESFAVGIDGVRLGIKNQAWVKHLRDLPPAVETNLSTLTTIDDVLGYEANFSSSVVLVSSIILSFRQFVLALEFSNPAFITEAEAANFSKNRDIPAVLQAVVDSLPAAELQKKAIRALETMTEIPRSEPLIAVWASVYAATNNISETEANEIIDDFFLAAFEV